MKYEYYGGPMDGAEIPDYLVEQDYLLLDKVLGKHTVVTYYYVKCLEHPRFEYCGEVEDEDE